MVVIDLKQEDLEQVLRELPAEKRTKMQSEILDYDEYYLTSGEHAVKVFRQEFVKDPHMNLPSIKKVRLVNYDENTDQEDLEDIFERDNIPIITRMSEGKELLQFRHIPNRDGEKETSLLPVMLPIPTIALVNPSPLVRTMRREDLLVIEEMFRKEYSLRYRIVNLMWEASPQACFVFEEKDIFGVTFNNVIGKELYMRQIFVREGYRGKGIGKTLYQTRLEFARQQDLETARGNIRKESRFLHKNFHGSVRYKNPEHYVIRGYIK